MNKRNLLIFAVIVSFIIILSAPVILYINKGKDIEEKAKRICIDACKNALKSGIDTFKSPCLLNPIEQMPDWVCDVAHNPREDIDNLPENQCSLFLEGKAKHFVEVSPSCEIIRVH